jgi:parallel beta-helix repeat protein
MHLLAFMLCMLLPTIASAQQAAPAIRLHDGLVITRSVRIVPGRYALRADTGVQRAVITIRGNDIDVDFAHAELRGAAQGAEPDEGRGLAIFVDGGSNVTIRNAKVRGYRVAIRASRTRNLRLIDNDLSWNWKPRLYSLIEHESLADWLSHHKNDKDEWLRFGAAAYLGDIRGGEIRGNTMRQGMEGLMLTRSDSMRIIENDISFNSGVGIGLYRSSDNVIMHNRVDYNVRGFSKFYRRGQDSADLLMYEQSNRNVVAYNSMTHGGDGLFLWAGQHTMDTGEGGANDNLFYGNDFSFAPTNGMEATFSRNRFVRNRIEGSDHGLWGGYSFNSLVAGNTFVANRIGIAIEHGQNDSILGNRFERNGTTMQLWANKIEPSDWQYPKKRDTRSVGYVVDGNSISDERVGLRISDTRESRIANNTFTRVDTTLVFKDSALIALNGARVPLDLEQLAPPKAGRDVIGHPMAVLDRAAIIVTEWGPYDWSYPFLWPADSSRRNPLALRVLGPAGNWKVVRESGIASLSRRAGASGDTIVVTPANTERWKLELESAGHRFAYEYFEPAQRWSVRFFAWSDSTDPRKNLDRLLSSTPLVTRSEPRLDYMWYRPTIAGLPQAKVALEATSRVVLPQGMYTLRTISDDAVRVWIDGRLAIDNWVPHESAVDVAPLTAGAHDLRVVHYQVDGWTELRLDIVRGQQRAGGSPGPH